MRPGNLLTHVTYTPAGTTAPTSSVQFGYDADTKGALSLVSTTVPAGPAQAGQVLSTAYMHDGYGRIATSTQMTYPLANPTNK